MINAFKKGMEDAPKRHQVMIRNEIKAMIGITSREQFRNRRDGRVRHSPVERVAIEAIFKKYGIDQPWGEE